MDFFGKHIQTDSVPMHVAPGGSLILTLSAAPKFIASLLINLREEIAFGLVDASENGSDLSVSIYFGNADEDSFKEIFDKIPELNGVSIARQSVKEGETHNAVSISSRNQVIRAISEL